MKRFIGKLYIADDSTEMSVEELDQLITDLRKLRNRKHDRENFETKILALMHEMEEKGFGLYYNQTGDAINPADVEVIEYTI